MIKNLMLLMTTTLFVLGCGKAADEENAGGSNSVLEVPICTPGGTFVRCSADGNRSIKVTITINGSAMTELIQDYPNTTCSGSPNTTFPISGNVTFGVRKASAFVAGGTDTDLTTNIDIFSCGTGNKAYTVLKIADDCSKFYSVTTAPSCDPNNRGTVLDPQPFIRQ